MIFDKGKAGLFPLSYREKKTRPNLSEAVRFVCRNADSLACSFVQSQAKTIVERELADLGRMAACRNQISG
jgi:hypothetical protein